MLPGLLTYKTVCRCSSLWLILLHLMMMATTAAGGRAGLVFSHGRLLASPNSVLQLYHESQPTIEEVTQISDRSSMLGHSNELSSDATIQEERLQHQHQERLQQQHQERLQQQHQERLQQHRRHILMGFLSGQVMKMSATVQIGSHPPSCQNKCNMCNPCDAVQMPTPQGHQSLAHFLPHGGAQFETQQTNYNPESWKCKCGDSFFNP
jgi:TolA-binding protein